MIEHLPTVNAILNSLSAVLLVLGYRQIKLGRRENHKRLMIATVSVSALFLASYLTYHWFHGSTRFLGEGWIRPVYFIILISHTILAASVVPLVLITLRRGLKSDFLRHKRIARWTFPIWLYVSVTGVIVYLLLYHLV